MATNRKIERALSGPGIFEITFGVILSLALGVLIAAIHLVFKPVEVVAKQPDPVEAGKVYVLEGSVNSSKSRQWTRKKQMLVDGTTADISFSEEELNAWAATAAPQVQKGAATASPDALFTPERVNFRISSGVMQVALLGKFSVIGLNLNMVFHTRGKFVQGAKGFEFKADELFLGSLPTHFVPSLMPMLIGRAMAAQELPEDLKTSWTNLTLVAVEDNTLRFVLP